MTAMPLLPAQPNAARPTYRGSDDAALSCNEPDAGATFADMLAAGVQPPQNATGALTAGRRQASHPADGQAKHRHAAHKADPDGTASSVATPAAIPTPVPVPVQQTPHGGASAATGSTAQVVTNGGGDPTDPANRTVGAAALAGTSGTDSVLVGGPASPATPVSGSSTASIQAAAQSTAQSAAQPTPSGGDDFGKVLSEFGTSATSSASRQLGTTPPGDSARTVSKLPSRAANEPSDGVTRSSTLDHGTLVDTRFDAGTTDIEHRPQEASRQAAAHQRSTEHSPVIATIPAPSAASVLSSSGHLAAGTSAPPQQSAAVTAGQPQPAAPPQPVHRQVSDALLGVRARGDGTHRMTLELHPADLGQVTVEVRIHAGAVSINLGSANDEARRSLSQALPQLRAELADAGLGGASVSVGADSSGGSAAHQNGTSGQPASGTRSDSVAQQGSNDLTTTPVRSYPARTGVDRWL